MKKKKENKNSGVIALAVMLMAAFSGLANGESAALLPVIIIVLGIIIAIAAKGKKSPSDAQKRMYAHEMSTAPFTGGREKESTVKCTCSRGRQRFLDQAEMFYKNGLIDKEEYRVMRERYMKLDIPDEI